MTRLEFLLANRAYVDKWMAVDASELPGTLTHNKLAALSVDTECELLDFECLSAEGWVLVDPETNKVYSS